MKIIVFDKFTQNSKEENGKFILVKQSHPIKITLIPSLTSNSNLLKHYKSNYELLDSIELSHQEFNQRQPHCTLL